MRVSFYTLGCKVNQNESGALAGLFARNGYTVAAPGEPADVYIVNSCTVTAEAAAKSRRWLRRVKRQDPAAVTVLCGCWPQAFPEEAAAFTAADVVMGATARRAMLDNIQKVLDGTETRVVDIRPHEKGEAFEELPMDRFAGHTRAFVKVEDGCDRRCAYCVIPRARGPVRSRSEESILQELRRLAAAGYREVVLTAISLPSYGRDTGTDLASLVEKAAGVPGLARIRLGSLDPDMLPDAAIARLAAVPQLCPQFHLSLQSGCDRTLRAMRRPYTAAQYAEKAACLRAAFGAKNVSLTTDVIVGFPGETDADFAESLAFVAAQRFLKVHVFPYSRRAGTPAFDMPGQVPEAEKMARAGRMGQACEAIRGELAAGMAGRVEPVLLETPLSATVFTGYTPQYLPVAVTAPGHRSGDIVPVRLGGWDGAHCRGTAEREGRAGL